MIPWGREAGYADVTINVSPAAAVNQLGIRQVDGIGAIVGSLRVCRVAGR